MDGSRAYRPFFAVVLTTFAPFVLGYFLSYVFRTVNAPLNGMLTKEFSLDPAQLGFLTSCYFITATLAQLPLGMALDKYGPGRVQGSLMLLAAVGAAMFARADSFAVLAIGRALIGLGVAGALMAGMKANVMALKRERVPLMNGAFIAIGSAGAVATSLPLDWLLSLITWRELFYGLAIASAVSALLILVLVPHMRAAGDGGTSTSIGLRQIVADTRFWRLAPLSALICGSAWAIQGLWAAPWLRDVAAMDRSEVAAALFAMASALCVGALGFGVVLDCLRRRGIGPDGVFSVLAAVVITAETAIAFHWPVPTYLLLVCIGASGAATVVSYSITPLLFPQASVARANSALNVMHFGIAFAVQNLIGLIVNLWSPLADGRYPAAAYGTAFLTVAVMHAMALFWFVWRSAPADAALPHRSLEWPNFRWRRWIASAGAYVVVLLLGIVMASGWLTSLWPGALASRADDRAMRSAATEEVKRLAGVLEPSFAEQKAAIASLRLKLEGYETEVAQLRPQLAETRRQLGELQAMQAQIMSDVAKQSAAPMPAAKIAISNGAETERTPSPGAASPPSAINPTPDAKCDSLPNELSSPTTIGFDRDQEALQPAHHDILNRLVAVAARCPRITVEIDGHSDSRGPEQRNVALSKRRAGLTAKYFEAHGIGPERLTVDGLGAANPVPTHADAEGRARNRRVEVTLHVQK